MIFGKPPQAPKPPEPPAKPTPPNPKVAQPFTPKPVTPSEKIQPVNAAQFEGPSAFSLEEIANLPALQLAPQSKNPVYEAQISAESYSGGTQTDATFNFTETKLPVKQEPVKATTPQQQKASDNGDVLSMFTKLTPPSAAIPTHSTSTAPMEFQTKEISIQIPSVQNSASGVFVLGGGNIQIAQTYCKQNHYYFVNFTQLDLEYSKKEDILQKIKKEKNVFSFGWPSLEDINLMEYCVTEGTHWIICIPESGTIKSAAQGILALKAHFLGLNLDHRWKSFVQLYLTQFGHITQKLEPVSDTLKEILSET